MPTLKRQKADGTWEYLEVFGKFVRLTEDFVADTDNTSVIPIQNSYSKITDELSVFLEGIKLNDGEHYRISPDSQSIELLDWVINTGDKIEIEILKNASDVDNLVSGSQLSDGSVDKVKLSQALQDEIDSVESRVSVIENDVVGNVSELDGKVDEHLAEDATNAHLAKNIGIEDINDHFTGSDLEAVLEELFTNADNAKNSFATVVGSPAQVGDTVAVIQTVLQNAKNTMATNLTDKGQSSTGTEALQALANKIANVTTGVKFAKGSIQNTGTTLSVIGLGFTPGLVVISAAPGAYTILHVQEKLSSWTLHGAIHTYMFGTNGNINDSRYQLTFTNGGFSGYVGTQTTWRYIAFSDTIYN